MPACFSEQGGSHRRGGSSATQIIGEITMTYETKEQQRKRLYAEFLRRLRGVLPEAANGEKRKIEIKAPRETLSPLGWFYKHNAMHSGAIPIEHDQWGRCARCVTLGFFKCDA